MVEDATVVERSELIVVAHLKKGSILKVSHEKSPVAGASWEHHAVLVITTVLKGKCDKQEIPLIIHYGLLPLVRGESKDSPKNVVQILDDGGSNAVKTFNQRFGHNILGVLQGFDRIRFRGTRRFLANCRKADCPPSGMRHDEMLKA
jgi:hypothetical protein